MRKTCVFEKFSRFARFLRFLRCYAFMRGVMLCGLSFADFSANFCFIGLPIYAVFAAVFVLASVFKPAAALLDSFVLRIEIIKNAASAKG